MKPCFSLMKCLLVFTAAFIVTSLSAQSRKITGRVLSETDNSPMQGVTVAVKGKKTITQTEANGTYSIQAAKGDVLAFSFTGFVNAEVVISNNDAVNLVLKSDVANLNDVVVIGYGTQSKRNVTSAISKLDNAVLASTPRANIGSALQGTVAGLQVVNATGQPGASPVILLRGGASINSPGAPFSCSIVV